MVRHDFTFIMQTCLDMIVQISSIDGFYCFYSVQNTSLFFAFPFVLMLQIAELLTSSLAHLCLLTNDVHIFVSMCKCKMS